MKNKLKYIIFFISLFLVSCITNKSTRLLQEGSDIPVYDQSSYKEYKLKVNDELNVRILSLHEEIVSAFNLESESSSGSSTGASGGSSNGGQPASAPSLQAYRIYPDGTIDIPFADSIPVVGLTLEEARMKIEERLKNVANDVQVKVGLANSYFYMLGRSGKGQHILYKDRLTIYQAIALSAFSPGLGDLKDVKIIRQQENGTPSIADFDLRSRSIIGSEYYYVQPNDVIYVGAAKGSFFKIQSLSSFVGVVSSSLMLILLVLQYTK